MDEYRDKLEAIHKDVQETKALVKENTGTLSHVANVLLSIRDNMWHQYRTIHDFLLKLFTWGKKE